MNVCGRSIVSQHGCLFVVHIKPSATQRAVGHVDDLTLSSVFASLPMSEY